MRAIILITLFFICAIFISFTALTPQGNKTVNVSGKLKIEDYLTQYNPDFQAKGITKSSFKHVSIIIDNK